MIGQEKQQAKGYLFDQSQTTYDDGISQFSQLRTIQTEYACKPS